MKAINPLLDITDRYYENTVRERAIQENANLMASNVHTCTRLCECMYTTCIHTQRKKSKSSMNVLVYIFQIFPSAVFYFIISIVFTQWGVIVYRGTDVEVYLQHKTLPKTGFFFL